MKKIIYFLVLLLVSCHEDIYYDNLGEKLSIKSIELKKVETRNILEGGAFPKGSVIGICIGENPTYESYANIAVSCSSNNNEEKQSWSTNKDVYLTNEKGLLYSYYPYMENVDFLNIPVQSGDTDYLYGTAVEVSSNNNNVNLSMNHALAAIEFLIKKGTYGRYGEVSDIIISSDIWADNANLDATTGELSNISNIGNDIKNGNFILTEEGYVINRIVIPSDITGDINVKIVVDGYTYSHKIENVKLSQGTKNQYIVSFNEDEIILSSAFFKDWAIIEKETAAWQDIFDVGNVLTAHYDINDINVTTQILSNSSSFYISDIRAMEIDGVIVNKTRTYNFNTTGKHVVRYLLNNGATAIPSFMFSGCNTLCGLKLSENIVGFNSNCLSSCVNLNDFSLPENFKYIGDNAFYQCPFIKNVHINKDVTFVGINPFGNCPNLESITVDTGNEKYDSRDNCNGIIEKTTENFIAGCKNTVLPNSLKSIGEKALWYCNGLTEVDIPEGVTSIGSYAFAYCKDLIEIKIPEGVSSIKKHTFRECSGLVSAELPSTLMDISSEAFSNCLKLLTIKSNAPAAPKISSSYTFKNCPKYGVLIVPKDCVSAYSGWLSYLTYWTCIDSNYNVIDDVVYSSDMKTLVRCLSHKQGPLDIPSGVTSIKAHAFSACEKVTDIKIPSSITNINDYAFQDCVGMTSIEIPTTVTSIGDYAFSGCTGLTEVAIPNSVKYLYRAFQNCTGLNSVVLGSGVSTISNECFSGCTALESIVVDASNKKYDSRDNCNAVITTSSNTLLLGCKNTIIPESVLEIGNYAFQSCKSLQTITIPNSVTKLGYYSFAYCDGLKNITLGSGVKTIGEYAFYKCSNLSSVTLPNTIENIYQGAFYGCASLIEIMIPNSVKVLSGGAFRECAQLQNVHLPESLSEIGTFLFENCLKLKEITIPSSVTSIGQGSFKGCKALDNVIIPNSVKTIGQSAFYDCDVLKELIIPESINYIGAEAFYSSGIKKIYSMPITPPEITSSTFKGVNYGGLVFVPENAAENYTSNWMQATSNYYLGDMHWVLIEGNDYLYENGIYYSNNGEIAQGVDYSFSGTLSLREGVKTIRDYAFYNCDDITDLITPVSLETIGEQAFTGCDNMNNAILNKNISEIGDYAFYNCSKLKQINVLATKAPTISSNTFKGVFRRGQLKVPYGCTNAYKSWMSTSSYYLGYRSWICLEEGNYTIDNNIIYSSDYKTVYGYNIKENLPNVLQIKEGGENIVPNAFYNCQNIKEIIIPNSVATIGDFAFSYCVNVEKITIGEKVESIGDNAFNQMQALKNVISYAELAPSIKNRTFVNSARNVSISIPRGSTSSYSVWMQSSSYYPGYYNWKLTER